MNSDISVTAGHLKPIADQSDCLHLECGGNLDFAALAMDSDPLTTALGKDVYARRVLLNCERLGFLDTSGISWLIDCHKRFIDHGGRLVLYAVPPLAHELIELLRLDHVFCIRPDLLSARAAALEKTP
jgi:anti-anti-sigma factor